MQVACKTIKVKAKKLPRDGSRRAHQEDEFAKLLQERDILMGLSHVCLSTVQIYRSDLPF
jgi:hypothetical protein